MTLTRLGALGLKEKNEILHTTFCKVHTLRDTHLTVSVVNHFRIKMKKYYCLFGFILINSLAIGQKSIDDFDIIEDSTNLYQSIDEILEHKVFKNKVVFVDIWGTTCKPCLKEFAYIKDLKDRFKNEPVEYLYACSPNKMTRDKQNISLWKKLIVKYNLEGLNVYMSPQCYEEGFFEKYSDKYPANEMYAIPAYLLVNINGEIVDSELHGLLQKKNCMRKLRI
jgi:thiol-disulfide isomerase/thioredoxin